MRLNEVDLKYPHLSLLLKVKIRSFLKTYKLSQGEEYDKFKENIDGVEVP